PNHNWFDDNPDPGTLLAYDLTELRSTRFQHYVNQIRMASDNQTLFDTSSKSKIRAIDANAPLPAEGVEPTVAVDTPDRRTGFLDLKRAQILVQPGEEWRQMYAEAWRLQSEHFWDAGMSDVDWNLVHDRYATLLPRVRTRS